MSEEIQQEKSTTDKYQFGAFPLYEHKTPEFRERTGYKYIFYGDDNAYSDYLIYLYSRSAIHNSIVNGKTRFILGRGWKSEDESEVVKPNLKETLDEMTHKVILDRLIFGGYALRIVWFNKKIISIYHEPFQKIRANSSQTEYYISNEWTRDQSTKARFKASQKMPDDLKVLTPFNPKEPKGEQLLYVCDYRPNLKIYPLPEYLPSNSAIETDIEIDNFHINNIKSGFAAGTMITLFNGKPSPDEAKKVERDLKAKFTGTDNGGEVVLNFAELNEKEPLVTPLRSNGLSDQYQQLSDSTIQKIFIGHNISSPMLFGLKTEGQLGGRSEMDIAWELLNINYVTPRRLQFESEFNYILQFSDSKSKLELVPLKPLGVEFNEETIKSVLTKKELREMVSDSIGLESEEETNDTLSIIASLSPIIQTKVLSSMTTNQILNMVGLPSIPNGDTIPQDTTSKAFKMAMEFDAILLDSFSKIGISEYEFADAELSKEEQILLDYIKGKKVLDINQAKKDLKIDVQKVLDTLIKNNIIQGTYEPNGNVKVKDIQEPNTGYKVKTYWQYSGPKDSKNRTFCAKMLELNNLYTKEEIDNLDMTMKQYNEQYNYINGDVDIWSYRGGWYTVPNTDGLLHKPSCRHSWNQVLVKEKI